MIRKLQTTHRILLSVLFVQCGHSVAQTSLMVTEPTKPGSTQESLFKQVLVRAFGPFAASLSETQQTLLQYTAAAAAAYVLISLMRRANRKSIQPISMTTSSQVSGTSPFIRDTSSPLQTPGSLANQPTTEYLPTYYEKADPSTMTTQALNKELSSLNKEIRDLQGRVDAVNAAPPAETDPQSEKDLAEKRKADLTSALERKKLLLIELKRRSTSSSEQPLPALQRSFAHVLKPSSFSSTENAERKNKARYKEKPPQQNFDPLD